MLVTDKRTAINKIGSMLGDGLVTTLLGEISHEIALEIVETSQDETIKREELYMLNKALKRLNEKLQEYVNNYNDQEI